MVTVDKFSQNYEFLLESILKTDKSFGDIIQRLATSGNRVAYYLHAFVNKDITTNINYLSPGKANDEVSFVNDTQVARIADAGRNPFETSRNNSKVGRAVRQILTANKIEVTDKDIEVFVNQYRIAWDEMNKPISIELVQGEEIRKWYLESKYAPGGGQLNNSCMRYPQCQQSLDIYVKNPEVCQLVILKSDDGTKLLGRALLWQCSEDSVTGGRSSQKIDIYLDRIYTVFDHDRDKIKNFIRNKFPDKLVAAHVEGFDISKIKVSLKETMFPKYPYMDSLFYIYPKKNFVTGLQNSTDLIFQARATDGSKSVLNWKYSTRLQEYFPASECVVVDSINSYMPISQCVRDYRGAWVWNEDAIQSELYGVISRHNARSTRWGMVPNNEVVAVLINSTRSEYYPKKLEGTEFFQVIDKHGSRKYVIPNMTFEDVFKKRYLVGEKRFWTSERSATWNYLCKGYPINEEDVIKLGEVNRCNIGQYANIATYQLYSLPDTDIPVAIEYSVPISPTASESKSSGVVAITTDVNAFRLRKKRAARGEVNPDIFIPKSAIAFDYYLKNPITDELKSLISNKATQLGNEATAKVKMDDIKAINQYLYGNSNQYQRNLKLAVLRLATNEDLYKSVNVHIADYWKNRDQHIKQYLTDLPRTCSTIGRGIMESMLDDFNSRQPFGAEKEITTNEFKKFLIEKREMFICQCYLWSLTRDRSKAARTASRYYGYRDRRSVGYLASWSYNRHSGVVGERIFSSCENFFSHYRTPQADPIQAMKCEAAYPKLIAVDNDNMLIEGLAAWEMFKRDHLDSIFPKAVIEEEKKTKIVKGPIVKVKKSSNGLRNGGYTSYDDNPF